MKDSLLRQIRELEARQVAFWALLSAAERTALSRETTRIKSLLIEVIYVR